MYFGRPAVCRDLVPMTLQIDSVCTLPSPLGLHRSGAVGRSEIWKLRQEVGMRPHAVPGYLAIRQAGQRVVEDVIAQGATVRGIASRTRVVIGRISGSRLAATARASAVVYLPFAAAGQSDIAARHLLLVGQMRAEGVLAVILPKDRDP